VMIWILLLAAIVCCGIIRYDTHHFHIVRYQLANPKLKKALRVVVLADLHDTVYGTDNAQLYAAVKEQKPDLILIAGDMVTASRRADFGASAALLEALAAEFPVYYGMGNHESRIAERSAEYGFRYEDYQRRLLKAGVVFLEDDSLTLPQFHIVLHGLELEECYYHQKGKKRLPTDYLRHKFGMAEESYFHLLIAHNPDYFPQYAEWGADLTVSGHVHGGIVRLPVLGGVISTSFRLFPKYDGGLFTFQGTAMVISRGLGSHTIPLRMFNPGECVVIDMEPGEIQNVHTCKAGEV
ncbi:MAG: metallophosphoesterase, partial [Lachnospiraceae bacterium]|nr:metallophosphoesterase [Lachnospiraceae bacterium]